MEGDEETVRALLEKLTGFPHAVFVQTGTAATEIVLSVLTRPKAKVALPALGCWTLSYATTKLGRTPRFRDVDKHWAARPDADDPVEAAIVIDPWGGPASWPAHAKVTTLIADVTLSPGARLRGEPPAAYARAAVASLGGGKPIGIGGGGVALFRDAGDAHAAKELLRFGFRDGRWDQWVERYSFAWHLFGALAIKLAELPSAKGMERHATRARKMVERLGLDSNALVPGGAWGYGTTVPLLLPKNYPLSTRDVEGVAVASGVRLARHPVSPPYREKVWPLPKRASGPPCPRAEDIASRLLFAEAVGLDEVARILDRIAVKPSAFRSPFPLPRPRGDLPADLEKLARAARLVRNADGKYGLLEEAQNLLWPIDEREASLVQAQARVLVKAAALR